MVDDEEEEFTEGRDPHNQDGVLGGGGTTGPEWPAFCAAGF